MDNKIKKPTSMKSKVIDFWRWFTRDKNQLEKLIDDDESSKAGEIIATMLMSFDLPCRCIVGYSEGLYELAISPNGEKIDQFLCKFIKKLAPIELVGRWDISSYAKALPVQSQGLAINDVCKTDPLDYKINYSVDLKSERINIQVCHPNFNNETRDIDMRISMFLLYTVIGEALTEVYIGTIETFSSEEKLNKEWQKTDIFSLGTMLTGIRDKFNWEDREDPTQVCYGYQLPGRVAIGSLRDDIVIGYTKIPHLLDYSTTVSDKYKAKGVNFLYAYYPNHTLSKKDVVQARDKKSKELQKILESYSIGYVIGGATGVEYSYIDIMVLDKDIFNAVIKEEKAKLGIEIGAFGSKNMIS